VVTSPSPEPPECCTGARLDQSRVSIVLPTHNGSAYLKEALESCLHQTHHDLELILVDDCSSDDTPVIIDGVSDPRVKRVHNQHNQGLARSLNIGFRLASGKYLTWTSDDNLYEPTAIQVMASYLDEHPEVGLVYADYWNIDAQGKVIAPGRLAPPTALVEYNCVNACFLYRREVLDQTGDYDPDTALAEDYDYWLRVSARFRLAWLQTPLYYYRRHSSSLTNRHGFEAQQRAVEAVRVRWVGPDHLRFPSRLSRSLGRVYLDAAFDAHRQGSWRQRRIFLLRALRYDPRHLAQRGVRSLMVRSIARLAAGLETEGV